MSVCSFPTQSGSQDILPALVSAECLVLLLACHTEAFAMFMFCLLHVWPEDTNTCLGNGGNPCTWHPLCYCQPQCSGSRIRQEASDTQTNLTLHTSMCQPRLAGLLGYGVHSWGLGQLLPTPPVDMHPWISHHMW